jgi:hypothetical protein
MAGKWMKTKLFEKSNADTTIFDVEATFPTLAATTLSGTLGIDVSLGTVESIDLNVTNYELCAVYNPAWIE